MRQIYCLVILFISTFSIHLPGADLKLQSLDNFHPYIWQSDEGLDGIDMSMIKELEKRTGSKLEVELTPWKRLLQNIKDGSVDGGVWFCNRREGVICILFKSPIACLYGGYFCAC